MNINEELATANVLELTDSELETASGGNGYPWWWYRRFAYYNYPWWYQQPYYWGYPSYYRGWGDNDYYRRNDNDNKDKDKDWK